MNISSFKKAYPFLRKNNTTPFLWGSQGVGKTETMRQIAAENGLQLVTLHTATQDVGDLIGLLTKDEKTKTVSHARPEWFPTEGKGIIFFDELNRAPNDVLQALFSMFTSERRIHHHQLPEGWTCVAAGNYQSDRFTTTDTSDAAFLSRFCHLDFTPSVEEFLVYAETKNAFSVSGFIREQPSLLEQSAKEAGRLDTSFIVPDRRAYLSGIAPLEEDTSFPAELRYEVYSGLIGVSAAAAFLSWKAKAEKSLSLDQVLKKYTGAIRKRVQELSSDQAERRFDLLNQPIDELFVKLEGTPHLLSSEGFVDNLKLFLLDIPKELSMKAFGKMTKMSDFHGKNEILNDPKYVELFK